MRVYTFDHAHELSFEEGVALLGGKGAGLWMMTTKLGLPVPPGLTIPTTEQARFDAEGLSDALFAEVLEEVARIGTALGRRFADPDNPLLLSVRSGAASSMPGMMDTILNVGVTPMNVHSLPGSEEFRQDTLRRFLRQFGETALDLHLPDQLTDQDLQATLEKALPPGGLNDPVLHLRLAIEAVFRSWNGEKARTYRQVENFDHAKGTAVTIQAMVFGNLDEQSGTGVVFSRDPSTGDPGSVGDFMVRAQGEDVVAGVALTMDHSALAARHPALHADLEAVLGQLEHHLQDMVDVEYTIECGKLWILQARRGKRSPEANARIAVDLANAPEFSVNRADAVAMARGEHAAVSHADAGDVLASGLGVSPGVATGVVVTCPEAAVDLAEDHDVILVRRETSPADIHGMSVAAGILTSLGGRMSHAAVVARDWALPAVVGAQDIEIDQDGFTVSGRRIERGQEISIDGTTGAIYFGRPESHSTRAEAFAILQTWEAELATR